MLQTSKLYRPFHLKKQYTNMNEETILTSLYVYKEGTLESIISKIINKSVLDHMDLNIDSTIMQVLALNEYLSELFMQNFNILIYNYCVYYFESNGIKELDEMVRERMNELPRAVNMKTELGDLNILLNKLCKGE